MMLIPGIVQLLSQLALSLGGAMIENSMVNIPFETSGVQSSCGTLVICSMLETLSNGGYNTNRDIMSTLDTLLACGLEFDGWTIFTNQDDSLHRVTHAAYIFTLAWQTEKILALDILDIIANRSNWNVDCQIERRSVNLPTSEATSMGETVTEAPAAVTSGMYVLRQIFSVCSTEFNTNLPSVAKNAKRAKAEVLDKGEEEIAEDSKINEIIPERWKKDVHYQIKDSDRFEVDEICLIKRSDGETSFVLV